MIDITWCGIVENYLEDGNIKPLAEKVRISDIPEAYRNQVADILLGTLTHKKQRGDSYLEREYKGIIRGAKYYNQMIDDFNRLMKNSGSTAKPMAKMTQQTVYRMISQSKKFGYASNYKSVPYPTVKRTINRNIEKKGWPTI